MLLNAALWLAVTLTFKGSEPKLAHWPNETVLHFQVVFVIS